MLSSFTTTNLLHRADLPQPAKHDGIARREGNQMKVWNREGEELEGRGFGSKLGKVGDYVTIFKRVTHSCKE